MNTITMNSTAEDNINSLKLVLASLRISSKKLQLKSSIVVPSEDVLENTLPTISLKEVAKHDSYNSCWIIIYDRVYDITNYLNVVSLFLIIYLHS